MPRQKDGEEGSGARYRMLPNDARLRSLETSDKFTATAKRTLMVDSCGQPGTAKLGTSRHVEGLPGVQLFIEIH